MENQKLLKLVATAPSPFKNMTSTNHIPRATGDAFVREFEPAVLMNRHDPPQGRFCVRLRNISFEAMGNESRGTFVQSSAPKDEARIPKKTLVALLSTFKGLHDQNAIEEIADFVFDEGDNTVYLHDMAYDIVRSIVALQPTFPDLDNHDNNAVLEALRLKPGATDDTWMHVGERSSQHCKRLLPGQVLFKICAGILGQNCGLAMRTFKSFVDTTVSHARIAESALAELVELSPGNNIRDFTKLQYCTLATSEKKGNANQHFIVNTTSNSGLPAVAVLENGGANPVNVRIPKEEFEHVYTNSAFAGHVRGHNKHVKASLSKYFTLWPGETAVVYAPGFEFAGCQHRGRHLPFTVACTFWACNPVDDKVMEGTYFLKPVRHKKVAGDPNDCDHMRFAICSKTDGDWSEKCLKKVIKYDREQAQAFTFRDPAGVWSCSVGDILYDDVSRANPSLGKASYLSTKSAYDGFIGQTRDFTIPSLVGMLPALQGGFKIDLYTARFFFTKAEVLAAAAVVGAKLTL